DSNGAIAPNFLVLNNTESNSYYLRRCSEDGIKPHPARFPKLLPEFFIKLLTDRGDLVLDPFLGSGSTAVAAVTTGRHYVGYESEPRYVEMAERRIADARFGQRSVRQ
ncbi:MAG: site-specific DNA-methyltransferase, partial [Actinobacteria bacterium]